MSLISAEDREYLVERYQKELTNPVTIEFFTRGDLANTTEAEGDDLFADETESDESAAHTITQQLLQELTTISPKIILNRHEVDTPTGHAAAIAANINPQLTPALRFQSAALAGQSRYYGMPTGFEFGTLIETISDFSRGASELGEATRKKIAAITTPLEMLIFVTPT